MVKKIYPIIVIAALSLLSCRREMDAPEKNPGFAELSVTLKEEKPSTKSVLDEDVEIFREARIFAFDSGSGAFISAIETDEQDFTWALPLGTSMDIFTIVNPPSIFYYTARDSYLTADMLMEEGYYCSSTATLTKLSSSGLPMTGLLVGKTIESAFETLSLKVKNIFAKYSIRLDKRGLPDGSRVNVTSLRVLRGNTFLPLFASNYRQDSPGQLGNYEYATTEDLLTLGNGGEIDIYVLENCQGVKEGASSWKTVAGELTGSDLELCTLLLLEYTVDSGAGAVPVSRRIYLGSDDMTTDFNVVRNSHISICITLGEEAYEPDPYFRFTCDKVITVNPGTSFTLPFSTNLIEAYSVTPSFSVSPVTEEDPSLVTRLYQDNSFVRFSVSGNCHEKEEYIIRGGASAPVYVSELGRMISCSDALKIVVKEPSALSLMPVNKYSYPYYRTVFRSSERYKYEKALSLLQSLKITASSSNIASGETEFSISGSGESYAIELHLLPRAVGEASIAISYGDGGAQEELSFYVHEPSLEVEPLVTVDVSGNSSYFSFSICGIDGELLGPPDFESENMGFSVNTLDQWGTLLDVIPESEEDGVFYCKAAIKGFRGLPGFESDNYSFTGLTIEAQGRFYFSRSMSIDAFTEIEIENPLEDYPLTKHEYKALQGRKVQESFVSTNLPDLPVDNMRRFGKRTFTVDIGRNGRKSCPEDLELWTKYSRLFPARMSLSGGKLSFTESLDCWGPLYIGKRITNRWSNETLEYIHSIVRIYSSFNVFSTFDIAQTHYSYIRSSDVRDVNWETGWLGSIFLSIKQGFFDASWKSNFYLGEYLENTLETLVSRDIGDDTVPGPAIDGFSLTGIENTSRHYRERTFSRSNGTGDESSHTFIIGELDNSHSYRLIYRPVEETHGFALNFMDCFDWRAVAAENRPWFKIDHGDRVSGDHYISRLRKKAQGIYSFNIIPASSKAQAGLYLDPSGDGYLSLHVFWEGKEGMYESSGGELSWNSSHNTRLCLVNGWYDPDVYENGIPIIASGTGMYFFPDKISTMDNTRYGFPAYSPGDAPYMNSLLRWDWGHNNIPEGSYLSLSGLMEREIAFGSLATADMEAPH